MSPTNESNVVEKMRPKTMCSMGVTTTYQTISSCFFEIIAPITLHHIRCGLQFEMAVFSAVSRFSVPWGRPFFVARFHSGHDQFQFSHDFGELLPAGTPEDTATFATASNWHWGISIKM